MAEPPPHKLPRFAIPRRYALELEPDLPRARFEGAVDITLDITEPTDRLDLNGAGLMVSEAHLQAPDGGRLTGSVTLDEVEQRMTVHFERSVRPGDGYTLSLRYGADLGDQLRGFYSSTFTDADGNERFIAATDLEPSDARSVFPCWDEPDFKATFAIRVVIDEGLTALSNEAAVSDEPLPDGRRMVRFAETMVMSTYLVALVVGPLELTQPIDVDGVPVRVAAVPGKLGLAGFATRTATHVLHFLSRYFEIPYPGGKIDHVALPEYAMGAMENLGCVTYRETALLTDPASASQVELQRVATVVAHETAHMWFGDLVTMRWWDGIWLNEAFATFMELTTTDDFNPAWQVWAAFGAGKAAALATDGLNATRPVEFDVGRPEEAEAMFDVLTYEKGASVLRMLEQYLGSETFRKGVSHYLHTHAYSNTDTTDLWDALEAISGEPVRAIMDTWIRQGGYPLISVERGDDTGSIALRQNRFLYAGEAGDRLWGVPVNLRASVGGQVQRQRLLLDDRSAIVGFDGTVDWVVVNDGGWGFYRTRYDRDLLDQLVSHGLQSLDPLERHALVVDTWASVVAGTDGLSDWAALVTALGVERDPDVWAAVSGSCDLLHLMGDEEDRAALAAFVRRVAGPVWDGLGWDPQPGEAERIRVARGRVLGALGRLGDEAAVRGEALERFWRWIDERSERGDAPRGLAPDLVTPVIYIAAERGGSKAWEALLGVYRTATNPQEKVRSLLALTATPRQDLLERCLALAISEEVRVQDAAFLVSGVLGRRGGTRLGWQWTVGHWDEILLRWPPNLVGRVVQALPAVVDADLARQVHAFAGSYEIPPVARVDQVLERMDINVALAARVRSTMASALTP